MKSAIGQCIEPVSYTHLSTTKTTLESAKTQIEDGLKQIADARDEALKKANISEALSPSMISTMLTAENFSMPAGYIASNDDSLLIKVGDQFASLEEVENLLLMSMEIDGLEEVRLKDLALSLIHISMEPGRLQEVYTADESGTLRGRTQISEQDLQNKAVQPVEYAGFVNSAGQTIDGWLIKPVDLQPDQKYPAILDIHGGPRTTYCELLIHEMQVWASAGYYVFFCNHRGSDGYGDAFADLRLKYGTIDYEDIMEFTDQILAQNPQIDPLRLGVTGGSYGGYMTNWIITHTHRFAAAASQRSISNWISDYGTSGISYDDDLHDGGKPWNHMEKMWDHSPLRCV